MRQRFVLNILLTVVLLSGGTTVFAQSSQGKASYYSKRFTGARTASGERLHPDSMTCAHRSYPFGTLLKVTNINTGKHVVVRVNDRGPFVKGRIIDLSFRAAKELGIIAQGVAAVKVEVYNPDPEIPYKAEDKPSVPELDLDMDVPDDPIHPVWQNKDNTAEQQKDKETD